MPAAAADVPSWRALNQCVLQALVIALAMIMLDELGDRPAEMPLTDRNIRSRPPL